MKKILLYFILLMALIMAGTVAFVSVSGLLKVFTGAGTMGLILFSAIEIAKIIGTSAIHTYGKRIGWFYKSLLSIMIIISMAITSMGIYGFLSSSYKASFAKMENVDAKVELLESKLGGYKDQLDYVVSEKESLNTTITELTKGLSNNVIQYKDPVSGEIITTTSSTTRKVLEKQLDNAILRQGDVNIKADSLSTVVFDLENDILETKLGNESANELSTLKYLADITGRSMDEVMSWFILLLIIIGDPMAVLLVVVFNKVVNPKKKGKSEDPKEPEPLTDDEIVEKARKIKLKGIFKKATEISKAPTEEDEEPSEEPDSDFVKQIQDNIRRGVPIEDEVISEAVDEAKNEFVETPVEESLPNPLEIVEEEGKYGENYNQTDIVNQEPLIQPKGVIEEFVELPTIVESKPRIDTQHEISLPKVEEEGTLSGMTPTVEFDGDIEDLVIDGEVKDENTSEEQIVENIEEVKQLKREPIVPRGKIIEEDVIPRGFSVDIPDPKANRLDTEDGENIHRFPRQRPDELGNE